MQLWLLKSSSMSGDSELADSLAAEIADWEDRAQELEETGTVQTLKYMFFSFYFLVCLLMLLLEFFNSCCISWCNCSFCSFLVAFCDSHPFWGRRHG